MAEVLELTSRYASSQKLLAGGQSLVPMMNMRLARPEQLIDLNRIQGLDTIREGGRDLVVGALTRQEAVEQSATVRTRAPLLSEAVRHIGHVQIRSRGTIGGSMCHADPAAELPAVLTAYDGELGAVSVRGERKIKAVDFFVSTFVTSLAEDEVLITVTFSNPRAWNGWGFTEVAKRHGDFALVSSAVLIAFAAGGVSEARIVLGSIAERPIRAVEAEAMLRGVAPDEDTLNAVASSIQEEVNPDSDAHASADYKRHVAGVLSKRSLMIAIERARANHAEQEKAGPSR
jgi:CO/xanthine dehydrogenase FAD-binding subunit